MTSAIIKTNPTAGTATTSSVRDNFSFASDEITALQRTNVDVQTTTGGPVSYLLNYGLPSIAIVDGTRVSARINEENTTATPVLTVSPATTPATIVKADGSALSPGDLIVDSTYDFMWNDSLSKWFCLNLSIASNQDNLLTTILGGLYPVGGLLTTTVATDPGTDDYFFSGITFGTWEAYAQGRTVVGIDTGFGTGFVSGSKAFDQVTIVITEKALSKGDSITVSGFTGTSAVVNGSWNVVSAVTAAGQTTVIFQVDDVDDLSSLVGTDVKVINEDFDTSQEIGGETKHKLTDNELASHMHHVFNSGINAPNAPTKTTFSNRGLGTSASVNYEIRGDSNYPTIGLASDVVETTTGNTVAADQPHNNLQPYITTYIWKRTA